MSRGGMPVTGQRMNRCGGRFAAAALALMLLSGGCSSAGAPSAPDAPRGNSGTGSISDFFAGSSAKGMQAVAGAQPDINCPPAEIRRGASTLRVASGEEKTALTLKYQGSFVRAARECAVVDGNMVMRVGIEGRIIVGPAGGPGQVDIPLRYAVVQEVPGGMKPVMTKFIIVPVVIGADGRALFSHVEDGMTFPVPTPTSLLDDYVVYIGFDPLTAEAQAKQPPKGKPRPKPKPKPAANN